MTGIEKAKECYNTYFDEIREMTSNYEQINKSAEIKCKNVTRS